MQFHIIDDTAIGFRQIHPLLAEFVRAVPVVTDPRHLSEDAQERLYPTPSTDPDLDRLRSDWQAFVTPDLTEHFQSARDVVGADLRRLHQRDGQFFEFVIPNQHAEAWLNVLNQARLTLAADAGYSDAIPNENEAPDLLSEHGVKTFQLNLYAFMQQCLVEFLE
jgi:hypothetical protein